MPSSENSTTQWGKLTSLNPNFENISLSKSPTTFALYDGLFQDCSDKNPLNENKCQIYQEKEDAFIRYTGSDLTLKIEGQALKEGEAFKINSGENIIVIIKKEQGETRMEYVFSSKLNKTEKNVLKREREENEEMTEIEKKVKFYGDVEDEIKCFVCNRMIFECASVVPCLHKFCMDCLMQHFKGSQDCPQCGKKFVELRKDTFFNNIIEAYEEKIHQKERSHKEIRERLNLERVFARFEYANGDVYEGEWKKCRKDGKGKMAFSKGSVYEGEWKNNKREGQGRMEFLDEEVIYEEDLETGEIEEIGEIEEVEESVKFIDTERKVYEGKWKNDQMEGKGRMLFKAGHVYEGNWKESRMQGFGKFIFHNGDVYEGDFWNHIMEGKGRMAYANGDIYVGSWRGNQREGEGKMVSRGGDIYEGDWVKNQMEGKGTMKFSMGHVYEGNWHKNRIEGKGKMTYPDGEFYDGNWKDFKREGKGKMVFKDGRIYEGEWKDDKIEGTGKMICPNGDVYEGKWRNRNVIGNGKLIKSNGVVEYQNWPDVEKEEDIGEN